MATNSELLDADHKDGLLLQSETGKALADKKRNEGFSDDDSPLVRYLKKQDLKLLRWSLKHSKGVILGSALLILLSLAIVPFFGTEFLPPFNEGSFTVTVVAPAGTL
jgi:HME family heavy-metal exporter